MGKKTKYYRLYKPSIGETDWGEEVNQNFNIIDKELHYLEKMIEKLLNMHNRYLNRLRVEVEIVKYPLPLVNKLEIGVSYEIIS